MKNAIITIGVPGSGKSTYAKTMSTYKEINRDDIRMDLFNLQDYAQYKFSGDNEAKVSVKVNRLLNIYSKADLNVIISDTHLNKKYRDVLVDKLLRMGYNVSFKVFNITHKEMNKRNHNRADKRISPDVLNSMYDKQIKFNAGM